MDNLDLLKLDGNDEGVENKTFLEFEISEQSPEANVISHSPDVSEDNIVSTVVPEPLITENDIQINEEFSMPDVFDVAAESNTESVIETPAAIRPTYLPKFTEVSDTYRMQNDPRPRPKTDSQPDVMEKDDELKTVELDATTEKLEEREVEKIVVISGSVRNSEPVDETLTVLKFSTPIDTETQD